MKRRNTRAALACGVVSTQQSQEVDYESDCDSGSESNNDPDNSSDDDSVSSTNNDENDDNNDNWVMEENEHFPHYPNIPRFNGPSFSPNSNISKRIFNISNPESYSPLQWFLEYLSEGFWQQIVQFTNDQAVDNEWEDLTISELWIFLALLFLRAIKQPPSYRDLWSSDWKYYCEKVHTLGMSRRRFELIRKCIKFNNGLENENDPYWRVRVALDELKTNCVRIIKPPQELSLDEMSPAFRGRSNLTISIKGKKLKNTLILEQLHFPMEHCTHST